MKVKVENIVVGDLVDLESCPHLKDHEFAPYEYCPVYEVCHNKAGFVAIGYESIGGLFEYPVGSELEVEK